MRDLLVLPKLGMKLGDLPIIIKEHTSLLHTDITSSHVAVHSQDMGREGNAFFWLGGGVGGLKAFFKLFDRSRRTH